MLYKFRTRVRIKAPSKLITNLTLPGVQSNAAFFEGTEGAVIRHDPDKGGYLVVLDCPEVKAAMGETITAYFGEAELEPLSIPVALRGEPQTPHWKAPAQAQDGPWEYGDGGSGTSVKDPPRA